MEQKPTIRPMRAAEYESLREWTYLSLFVPVGHAPFPREILTKPEVKHYYDDFGKHQADTAVVAEVGGKLLGAAWARILGGKTPGYGHLDEETPELAIAVRAEARGSGTGTALLRALQNALYEKGYRALSLSVQKENRAAGLYHRLGFTVKEERAEDLLMVLQLKPGAKPAK